MSVASVGAGPAPDAREDLAGVFSDRPPVRLVHLGLGAFHRSHQLWHTAHADPESRWGYASYTGRSPASASVLREQGGVYTVVTRGADGDRYEVIGSLVDPRSGADLGSLGDHAADPAVAVITLTVTEAGYRLDRRGRLDGRDPAVRADRAALRRADEDGAIPELQTVPGRLVFALAARRRSGAGPITVLPCDNMPANGDVVHDVVHGLAAEVAPELAEWIEQNVSFASSVVDRITPATTEGDLAALTAETGIVDRAAVVTEPFSEWIIAGAFPAGRPSWERSGARFVDDVAPFERRKLWLLNGAHTVLATTARELGHATVASAVGDRRVRGWLDEYWDAAEPHLPEPELEVAAYRRALLERFANPRIEHRLDQIAAETSTKLRYRIVPVMNAERERGRVPEACVRPIGAWVRALVAGRRDPDAHADQIERALATPSARRTAALVALLDPAWADDTALVARVDAAARTLLPDPPGSSH